MHPGRFLSGLRRLASRLWPRVRLRTMIFGMLLFVAALPGVGALYLRVYENALVRQTEVELLSLSLVLAQAASADWPIAAASPPPPRVALRPRPALAPRVDLADARFLPDVGAPRGRAPTDPAAVAVAGRLAPMLDEVMRRTGAHTFLLDARGRAAVADRRGDPMSRLLDVRIALAGRPATVLRRDDADPAPPWISAFSRAAGSRLEHVEPVLVGGKVVGAILIDKAPATLFDGLVADRWKILLGIALILGVLVGLSATLARAIVRPLERLSAAAPGLATGRGPPLRSPTLTVVEIDLLYRQVRAMSEVIARRARYLRDFSAALSHEFKSPLTSLRGGVELLQDHAEEMSEAQRQGFLANMAADTDRLNRLLGRLMELAEADLTPLDAGARCDPAACLGRLTQDWPSLSLALQGVPPVAIDPASLERVASILIVNSLQAGAKAVMITERLEEPFVVLSFADDGPGVPAADRSRLFEPFFTSRRTSGGTGLGLAIARSLVEAQGGAIVLAPSRQGAVFEVRLPRAY